MLTDCTTGPYDGGNNRARTCDPMLVRHVLSQLSYAPLLAALHQRRVLLYMLTIILSSTISNFFQFFSKGLQKLFDLFWSKFIVGIAELTLDLNRFVLVHNFPQFILSDCDQGGFHPIA